MMLTKLDASVRAMLGLAPAAAATVVVTPPAAAVAPAAAADDKKCAKCSAPMTPDDGDGDECKKCGAKAEGGETVPAVEAPNEPAAAAAAAVASIDPVEAAIKAAQAGMTAERERWATVMRHADAKGREAGAAEFLARSDMDADGVISMLPTLAKASTGHPFADVENPNLGPSEGGGDAKATESRWEKATATVNAQRKR